GNAPFVQRGEKAAKGVVQGIDLVQEPKAIGLAPGEVLPTNAQEQRPFGNVEIPLKESEVILPQQSLPPPVAQAGNGHREVRPRLSRKRRPGGFTNRREIQAVERHISITIIPKGGMEPGASQIMLDL